MQHSEILSALQNLINYKPTQQEIANILNVSINTIGARASRNSKYSYEEIQKIGAFYGVDLFKNRIDDYVNSLATSYANRKMQEVQEKKPILTPDFNMGVQYEFDKWGRRLLMLQVQSGMLDSSDFAKFLDIPERDLDKYIMDNKYPKGEHLLKIKTRFSKTNINWLLFGEN